MAVRRYRATEEPDVDAPVDNVQDCRHCPHLATAHDDVGGGDDPGRVGGPLDERPRQTGLVLGVQVDDPHSDARRHAETADSWRDRRHWRKETIRWADEESAVEIDYVSAVRPEMTRLDETTAHLEARKDEIQADRGERASWLADHPESARRLQSLDHELQPELPEVRALGQHHAANIRRNAGIRPPTQSHGAEID